MALFYLYCINSLKSAKHVMNILILFPHENVSFFVDYCKILCGVFNQIINFLFMSVHLAQYKTGLYRYTDNNEINIQE